MKDYGLIAGDAIVLALVTGIGFASHGELAGGFMPRMAASLMPLYIGWFLLAPWFGLYQEAVVTAFAQLWRPAFVMIFAGSLAAILRGVALNSPVIPSFAIVLGGTSAVGMTLWRLLWVVLKRRAVSDTGSTQPD